MHLKPSISFDEPPAAVSKFLNLAVHRPLTRYESSENLLDDKNDRKECLKFITTLDVSFQKSSKVCFSI